MNPAKERGAGEKKPRILLIGENPRSSSDLARWLEQRGGWCQFTASYPEVCRLFHREEFDLILSQMRLQGQSLYPLIDRLKGTRTTLFYWQPVERGCWWLPALWRGRDCFGSAALRPGEFMEELEGLMIELRFECEENLREKIQHVPAVPYGKAQHSRRQSRREPKTISGIRDTDLLSHKEAS